MEGATLQQNEKASQVPESTLMRVAVYSLIVNVGLVIAKLGLAAISGSLALGADGIHSIVDVIASIALITGIKLSYRKSKSYPYGLYKVENIVSVVIAFLIFLAAYEIVSDALSRQAVLSPYSEWVLVAVAILIPVPYILGMYEIRVGKMYNSPSLIADGKQHKADVLTTSIVFFAILGQLLRIPLDGIAAVLIAFFIIRSGWGILKDSMRTLLDASIDHGTLDLIRSVIKSDSMVRSVKNITGRNSGRYIFVEATVVMHGSDLTKAHLASERIEAKIRKDVPNIERVLIHYEPEIKNIRRYIVPLQDREGTLSSHFGEAPFFAIIDINVKERRLERQELIPNQVKDVEKRKGILAAKMLLAHEPDVVLTRESIAGKGPEYVLQAANILVKETEEDTIGSLIRQLKGETEGTEMDDR